MPNERFWSSLEDSVKFRKLTKERQKDIKEKIRQIWKNELKLGEVDKHAKKK
jgi:hypothetical protein